MIRWSSMQLEESNSFLVEMDCSTCIGGSPSDSCTCYNGTEVEWIDLNPLLHNLAIAGALAETWRRAQINAIEWWRGNVVRHHGPWGYAP